MGAFLRITACAVLCVLVASCGSCGKTDPGVTDSGGGIAAPLEPSKTAVIAIDANVTSSGACTLGHLGPLIDLGDASAEISGAEVELVEREGASWAKITGSRAVIRFAGPTEMPAEPMIVDTRIRGTAAKHMTMTLNGKLVGDVSLSRGDVKTVTAHGAAPLVAGTNELVLRFNLPRGSTEPSAEIDWLHVGSAEEGTAYVAPTHLESFGTSTLAGVPRRGYSVRGPGWLRCTGVLPDKGTFEASVGMMGNGEADIEARVLRDRMAPVVLGRAHVRGGEAWKPMSFGIDLPARTIGAIELAVVGPTPGARVLLAEARVTTTDPPATATPPPPKAKSAILVVLGSIAPRMIAPYGGSIAMPELAKIADTGALFESHRAASTWPSSSLASMLTGLSPRAHGQGERTMLDATLVTIADAAKQAGIATALYSANPTTGVDQGFARPFATYLGAPPGSGPMTAIFDEAARFLREHADQRTLVVVHARGSHPPWEVASDDTKKLAPDAYTGPLDPPHAGELLARARRTPPGYRLTEADRTRAVALQELAFGMHDAALGRLMAALVESKHDADTLVVVTSDVGLADHAFLSDADPLDEAVLSIPLVIRGPGIAKARVSTPTTSADLARTILVGLGLEPPATFGGADVRTLPPQPRPLVSSLDSKWSMRWLGWALANDGHGTMLCDLAADPGCATDAQAAAPLTMLVLRRTQESVVGAYKKSEPAYPTATTINALHAWGR